MHYIIEYKFEENGSPILTIKPAGPREKTSRPFAVHLNEVAKYSSDHNPNFEKFMFQLCMSLHELWGLGLLTSRGMAEIAMAIEDGIEDLIKMAPLPYEYLKGKPIGEGKLDINKGEQVHRFEVTDNGY